MPEPACCRLVPYLDWLFAAWCAGLASHVLPGCVSVSIQLLIYILGSDPPESPLHRIVQRVMHERVQFYSVARGCQIRAVIS